MSLTNALIAIVIMAAITFLTRAFPFLFFYNKKPPAIILFVGKNIPPVVITILVVYCLKDVNLGTAPHGLNELAAVVAVIALHLWRRNPLISIFGATILYMFLLQSQVVTRVFA